MKCDKGHIPELITRKQLVIDVHVKQKVVAMLTLLFTLSHILGKILSWKMNITSIWYVLFK